jgi:hypothetical protein
VKSTLKSNRNHNHILKHILKEKERERERERNIYIILHPKFIVINGIQSPKSEQNKIFMVFGMTFDALHHLVTVVTCVFFDGKRRSSGNEFFSSPFFSLSPPRKQCWPLQKKKCLVICFLS